MWKSVCNPPSKISSEHQLHIILAPGKHVHLPTIPPYPNNNASTQGQSSQTFKQDLSCKLQSPPSPVINKSSTYSRRMSESPPTTMKYMLEQPHSSGTQLKASMSQSSNTKLEELASTHTRHFLACIHEALSHAPQSPMGAPNTPPPTKDHSKM